MVTPSLAKEFAREGIALIPVVEGARLLAREACAAPGGAVELVVGSGFPGGSMPETPEMHLASVERIDPATHRYLVDHQLAGKPVLPVAMQIELLAAAAQRPIGAVEDFRLLKGVVVEGPVTLTVWLGHESDGRVRAELRGDADRVHARATLELGEATKLSPIASGPALEKSDLTPARIYEERLLFHGPRFHALAAVEGVGVRGIAVTLNAEPHDWIDRTLVTAPLALDGVFQALVLWTRAQLGAPSLPSRVGAWRIAGPLPKTVRAIANVREVEGNTAIADCDLFDENGNVVAQLEGYACTASSTLEAAYGRTERDAA
jgi:hypothetical protein